MPNVVFFQAKYVPLLAPFCGGEPAFVNPPQPSLQGIQIEPDPSGKGVHLFATDGHRLAWIFDKQGTAGGALVLDTPEAFVKACTDFLGPALMDVNGDFPDYDLPEWFRPGKVMLLTDICRQPDQETGRRWLSVEKQSSLWVHVCCAGKLPEGVAERFVEGAGLYRGLGDLQTANRPWIDWRKSFATLAPDPIDRIALNPSLLAPGALFAKAFGPGAEVRLHGESGMVVLSFVETDEVAAAIAVMPCNLEALDKKVKWSRVPGLYIAPVLPHEGGEEVR